MANLRLRLGLHNLSSDQVGAFREAYRQMMAINDNRGYQFFAGLHGAPKLVLLASSGERNVTRASQRMLKYLSNKRKDNGAIVSYSSGRSAS